MSQPTPRPPRRRRFQFSLRTLLIVAALAAVGALAWRSYVAPYHQQRKTMALAEKLGGSYKTAQAAAWLRRLYGQDFQNVVLVNLADCDDPAAYLDQVTALPALETLIVGGPAFTDDHLRRLHSLTTLSGLILDSTGVTDPGLAALREALPQADIYQSQRRTIGALNKFGPMQMRFKTVHTELRQLAGDEWFKEPTLFHAYRFDDASLDLVKRLTQLKTLSLPRTRVSDAGLVNLIGLAHLQRLNLEGTQVGDAGLVHLNTLTGLTNLNIRETKVTAAGVADLRRALPNCKIESDFE